MSILWNHLLRSICTKSVIQYVKIYFSFQMLLMILIFEPRLTPIGSYSYVFSGFRTNHQGSGQIIRVPDKSSRARQIITALHNFWYVIYKALANHHGVGKSSRFWQIITDQDKSSRIRTNHFSHDSLNF